MTTVRNNEQWRTGWSDWKSFEDLAVKSELAKAFLNQNKATVEGSACVEPPNTVVEQRRGIKFTQ